MYRWKARGKMNEENTRKGTGGCGTSATFNCWFDGGNKTSNGQRRNELAGEAEHGAIYLATDSHVSK